MSNQQIYLNLLRVRCVDETGSGTAEKFGNDEISMSGFGVDAAGKAVMLPAFSVYPHFDDGEVKTFPPKTLLKLDVPGDGAFPKTCTAALLLAEIDRGGFTDLARKAFEKLVGELEKEKKKRMAQGVSPLAIPWGAVWSVVGPAVIGFVKQKITAGLDDDVFPPSEATVVVHSPDFYWGDGTKLSPEFTMEFRGHNGVYYAICYWEIKTV